MPCSELGFEEVLVRALNDVQLWNATYPQRRVHLDVAEAFVFHHWRYWGHQIGRNAWPWELLQEEIHKRMEAGRHIPAALGNRLGALVEGQPRGEWPFVPEDWQYEVDEIRRAFRE